MARLGAQPNAIVNGPFEGRNAESIQNNFEKIFRRLRDGGGGAGLPEDPAEGDLAYFDGDEWVSLAIGTEEDLLRVVDGVPAWETVTIPDEGADRMGYGIQNQFALIARSGNVFGVGCNTGTSAGTVAYEQETDSTYRRYTTGAVSGNAASLVTAAGDLSLLSAQQDFDFICIVRTFTSIADVRIWVGLTDTTFGNNDDPGGTSDFAAFRYSTVAGDGGWVGVTRDGTTQSVTAAVSTIATSTRYKLRIRKSGSTVYFSVNDGVEVAKTTNLPGGTVGLHFSLAIVTQAAAAKSISFSRCHCIYGETLQPGTGALQGLTAPNNGDMLYGANAAYSQLPIGAANTVLLSTGSVPSWSTKPTLRDVAEIISGAWEFDAGFKEYDRSTKMGEFTSFTPTLTASGGSGGTWTVGGGSLNFAYTRLGKRLIAFRVNVENTSLSAAPNELIVSSLPFTFGHPGATAIAVFHGGAWDNTCSIQGQAGNSSISILRNGSAAYTTGAGLYIRAVLICEANAD